KRIRAKTTRAVAASICTRVQRACDHGIQLECTIRTFARTRSESGVSRSCEPGRASPAKSDPGIARTRQSAQHPNLVSADCGFAEERRDPRLRSTLARSGRKFV